MLKRVRLYRTDVFEAILDVPDDTSEEQMGDFLGTLRAVGYEGDMVDELTTERLEVTDAMPGDTGGHRGSGPYKMWVGDDGLTRVRATPRERVAYHHEGGRSWETREMDPDEVETVAPNGYEIVAREPYVE